MKLKGRATQGANANRKQQTKAAGTRVGVAEDWRSAGGKTGAKKLSRAASVRDGR